MNNPEAIKILIELTTRMADCRCGNVQITVPEMDAIKYVIKTLRHMGQ